MLYGEGATGAVVNVIPKKPFEGEIENHLRVGYGSYDSQQQAFDSGGSLTDTLSYRLNLNRLRSNGWIDRGDSSSDFISAALRWQATDDLAFTLAHDYGDQRPQNYFRHAIDQRPIARQPAQQELQRARRQAALQRSVDAPDHRLADQRRRQCQ